MKVTNLFYISGKDADQNTVVRQSTDHNRNVYNDKGPMARAQGIWHYHFAYIWRINY